MNPAKAIIALILLLLAANLIGQAKAGDNSRMVVTDQQGNKIVLGEKECSASPWLKNWYTGTFFYEKRLFNMCWKIQGQSVVIIDAEGDMTAVPMQAFHSEPVI